MKHSNHTNNSKEICWQNKQSKMEAGSSGAGLWLSHLLSKVSTVQSPLVGVINCPRHPGLRSLLGWSSTSLIPGWAHVSLQAQWGRQCRFAASILVAKWRGVSGWVSEWESEKKKKKGTCCKRRYVPSTWWSLHFQSSKMRLKQGGGIYKVALQREVGFTNWYCKSVMCELQKASVYLAEGSSYRKVWASNTDLPPQGAGLQFTTLLVRFCLCFKTP